jgi:hypothetical protein
MSSLVLAPVAAARVFTPDEEEFLGKVGITRMSA